ncbi:4860_t:CDS:1, partial [Funneliformis caledonium]
LERKLELRFTDYKYAPESFVFSSEDVHGAYHVLSRANKPHKAIRLNKIYSLESCFHPISTLLDFGKTLEFVYNEDYVKDYMSCRIKQDEFYAQPAIMPEGDYKIDEWEIFRVTERADPSRSAIQTTSRNYNRVKFDREKYNRSKLNRIPPRIDSPEEFIESIEEDFVLLIASWIDRREVPYTYLNMPFQFKLLFDMDDQSLPNKYYNQSSFYPLPTMKCHHGPSLMLMRIKDSKEIIGAYNPINWQLDLPNGKDKYVSTSESFIFSSKDGYGTDHRLSRVKEFDKAMIQTKVRPNGVLLKFGKDLGTFYHHGCKENDEPDYGWEVEEIFPYVKCVIGEDGFYEQIAIMPKGAYDIDMWEVYRVTRTK